MLASCVRLQYDSVLSRGNMMRPFPFVGSRPHGSSSVFVQPCPLVPPFSSLQIRGIISSTQLEYPVPLFVPFSISSSKL